MAEGRIGVGLWGLGEHARRNLLPAFRESSRARLRGVTTLEPPVLTEVAKAEGVEAYPHPAEMLEADGIQAVYLAVPNALHYEIGVRVLEAGKHLWCEKPLAVTHEERLSLLSLGERAGLGVLECTMFRDHPQFQRIERIVATGGVGRVRSVSARFGFPHLPPTDFRYQLDMGGGALLDAAFYPISAARLLLPGPLRVVGSLVFKEAPYEVDTRGGAFLAGPGGVTAFLEWGFGMAYRNEVEIWGEDGTLFAGRVFSKPPTLETTVRLVKQSGQVEEERVEAANHFSRMLDRFGRVTVEGDWRAVMAGSADQSRLVAEVLERSTLSKGLPFPLSQPDEMPQPLREERP
jgi:NDP-hexose-3-ketoreductase